MSVVQVTPREIRVARLDSFPGSVIGDLGLPPPPAQRAARAYEAVAPAQLPTIDGDVMLLAVARRAGDALSRLTARPKWRRLRAVRGGRVVRVDGGTWWTGGGILAARAALRDLDRALR